MSWIIGCLIGAAGCLLLHLILPSFEKQKDAERIARLLSNGSTKKAVGDIDPEQLHPIQKFIDVLIGEEFRKKYNELDREEGFESYLLKMFGVSLLMASTAVLYYFFIVPFTPFLILGPIAIVVVMWASLDRLTKLVKKREQQILHDLPLLFERMEVALEVGRSMQDIWQEVSRRCQPPMAKLLKKLITDSIYGEREALQTFADSIRHPTVYSLVSVVNVIRDRGFEEAESALKSIQTDMRSLRRMSLQEKNRTKPALLHVFLIVGIGIDLIFLFLMVGKMFTLMGSL